MTDIARRPLEGEILPPWITTWMAPCPTCGEAVDGYDSSREMIEYRELEEMWHGGPVVATGLMQHTPGPWTHRLLPCNHVVRLEDVRWYEAGGTG